MQSPQFFFTSVTVPIQRSSLHDECPKRRTKTCKLSSSYSGERASMVINGRDQFVFLSLKQFEQGWNNTYEMTDKSSDGCPVYHMKPYNLFGMITIIGNQSFFFHLLQVCVSFEKMVSGVFNEIKILTLFMATRDTGFLLKENLLVIGQMECKLNQSRKCLSTHL